MLRSSARLLLSHDLRGRAVAGPLGRFERFDGAGTIGGWPVLTHLPLAVETANRHAQPHDAAQLGRDVVAGRVARLPRLSQPAFVRRRQPRDEIAQRFGILEHLERTVGVNREIVPGRNDLAGFALGRVPRGRDIRVRSEEDCERFGLRRDRAPLRIGPREMEPQTPVFALFGLEQEWYVAGDQPVGTARDDRPERIVADRRVQPRDIVFFEMWWYIR